MSESLTKRIARAMARWDVTRTDAGGVLPSTPQTEVYVERAWHQHVAQAAFIAAALSNSGVAEPRREFDHPGAEQRDDH